MTGSCVQCMVSLILSSPQHAYIRDSSINDSFILLLSLVPLQRWLHPVDAFSLWCVPILEELRDIKPGLTRCHLCWQKNANVYMNGLVV